MKLSGRVALGIIVVLGVFFNCMPVTLAQDDSPRHVLPPVFVEPDVSPIAADSAGVGSFEFGGLDSVLRSGRSLFDDPRHVTIVDAAQLRSRQPVDMIDALERETGVLLQRTGAGQVSPFLRGLTGPQTLLLIDGVRMTNSTFRFGPNQNFGAIDPAMIERIEIVRGPQSVLFGSDAIGGVINVVTRGAARPFSQYTGGEFTTRFRSADAASYSRVSVEGSGNSLALFAGGSYTNVRDLDRGGNLGRQPLTNYSQYAGDVKISYLLSDQQLLTVSLQHVEQQDVPRSDRFPAEVRLFDPQQRDLGYIRWQGNAENGLFDTFMMTASFHRQKTQTIRRRPPTSGTEDRQRFDVETTGLNLVFSKDFCAIGNLTYGTDWYHDDVGARAERVDLASGASTPRTPEFPPDSYYERLGVFLQWDVLLTDRLSAVTGVRYSTIDAGATVTDFDTTPLPGGPPIVTGTTHISPSFQDWTASVGLVYEVTPQVHLVGSVAEGFRAPSLDDSVVFSDNVFGDNVDLPTTGLEPETSINYEVGVKVQRDRLTAEAYYFWTEIEGLIDRVPIGTSGGTTYNIRRNVDEARVQGLELAGQFLLSCDWTLYGNLAYQLGQNVTDAEPLRRIPPTQGTLGIRWLDPCNGNSIDLYTWLVARQDRLSPGDIADPRIPVGGTPGYATLSLRAGTSLSENQRLTLWLENLTDTAYRVHGSGVDGRGFSANLGYELRR